MDKKKTAARTNNINGHITKKEKSTGHGSADRGGRLLTKRGVA